MAVDGCWIVCRTCRFPIRLPRTLLSARPGTPIASFVLACPICGHVHKYGVSRLERVSFQIPDPFLHHRAVLYCVNVPCAASACPTQAEIFATAAEDVSVASLLTLWTSWTIHVRCRKLHLLKPAEPANWVISQYRAGRDRVPWANSSQ